MEWVIIVVASTVIMIMIMISKQKQKALASPLSGVGATKGKVEEGSCPPLPSIHCIAPLLHRCPAAIHSIALHCIALPLFAIALCIAQCTGALLLPLSALLLFHSLPFVH